MELPSDLIEEILSRVPARSLGRLRYTCKQWKTLIAEPRFVNKHWLHMRCREQQFTIFSNEHIVSLSFGSTISYVGIDFNKPEKIGLKLPFPIALTPAMNHCDGLLLYVTKSMLLVSNPLLNQKRWIKGSQGFDHSMDVYGLGYTSNQSSGSYDYKIVRFRCSFSTHNSSRLEVYAFKSESWKVVVDKNFNGFYGVPFSSVCLRGTPYWLGYNKDGKRLTSIQNFDFLQERFEPLYLPPPSIDLENYLSLGIFRGDQLSLLLECYRTRKIHLWVMKQQHWRTVLTVDVPQLPIFGQYLSSFIEKNGMLALYTESERQCISIYINVGENQDYQKIDCLNGTGRTLSDCCYVESLLQFP
ncbi:PREDICTED: putative F-box/LRR-repeat/kelch-repeat protein At1g11620 [Camelina sativa]|uniref:F-box/LRR-repeat/kelch-repeat protein At1g11620 n=1 Tax=Camelina sativa TaxID=90675 RepID=A0ABM0VMU3_CAMSA|nr:PREDICTED: putative F-box/LRR-repeat/kelch-repeat protein At1g11620 [Camelina sativa]